MRFTRLEEAFWLLGFLGHVTLLFVLLIRDGWRKFPVFTALVAYQLAESLFLYLLSYYGTSHAYYLAYWFGALADYALQLALTVELAAVLWRRDGTWIRTARTSGSRWAMVGILGAAALSLAVAPPSITGLDLWDLRATLFTSLLTCVLVLSVSMTSNQLRLQRGNHVMNLGRGLALWAGVAVLGDVLKIANGWRHDYPLFDQIRMVVYLGDLVLWSFTFWRPATDPVPFFEQVDLVAMLQGQSGFLAEPPAASR